MYGRERGTSYSCSSITTIGCMRGVVKDGSVVWKNDICRTLEGEKGICRAENGMANGKVS